MEILHETTQCQQEGENTANVVVFPLGAQKQRCKKSEAPPTDEELAEYRRIRPLLMEIIKQWPELIREHRTITGSCPLAIKLLASPRD